MDYIEILENKEVVVKSFLNKAESLKIIENSILLYNVKFGKKSNN